MRVSARGRIRELQAQPGPGLEAMLQLDRAARMPRLIAGARSLAAALRELDLVLVGLGSIGLHFANHCARLGVRTLLLIDPARFKSESCLTHPLQPDELGRSKVEVAGAHAKAVSPQTRVFVCAEAFECLPLAALAGASAILLATDNLLAESRVSRAALQLGIPLVQAAVEGRTLTAQVRHLANAGEQSPDLPCGYNREEWEQLDRGTRYSCAGAGSGSGSKSSAESTTAPAEPTQVPTTSVSHLCALAANLAMMELTRRAVGVGDPLASTELSYSAFSQQITHTRLERRASCPADHTRMSLAPSSADLGELSVGELLSAAGCDSDAPRSVSLHVEGRRFVALARCKCPTPPRVDRFVADDDEARPCANCGQRLLPHPLHVFDEVPLTALDGFRGRSLSSLGAPSPPSIRVRAERATTFLFRPQLPYGPARGTRGA
jgi:molybdopterin/thiamine biosynthesis adenylyltransferase